MGLPRIEVAPLVFIRLCTHFYLIVYIYGFLLSFHYILRTTDALLRCVKLLMVDINQNTSCFLATLNKNEKMIEKYRTFDFTVL